MDIPPAILEKLRWAELDYERASIEDSKLTIMTNPNYWTLRNRFYYLGLIDGLKFCISILKTLKVIKHAKIHPVKKRRA